MDTQRNLLLIVAKHAPYGILNKLGNLTAFL
jgi:hypothetical protein